MEVISNQSRESSGKIRSYRDLIAWQKSMDLMVAIYQTTETFPKAEQFGLTSQLKRAVVSVPSNIAEGSSRRSRPEFIRFLNIATGSLAEIETQITAAFRLNYIHTSNEQMLLTQCNEISRILQGLHDSLKHHSTLDSDY